METDELDTAPHDPVVQHESLASVSIDDIAFVWHGRRTSGNRKRVNVLASQVPASARFVWATDVDNSVFDRYSIAVTLDEVVVFDQAQVRWRGPVDGLSLERTIGSITLRPRSGLDLTLKGAGGVRGRRLEWTINQLGLQRPTSDSLDRTIPVVLIRGSDVGIDDGSPCGLHTTHDSVRLLSVTDGQVLATASGPELLAFEVCGPGETSTDGGYGYFASDFASAVKMEVITGWLNKQTSRHQVTTFVRVTTASWSASLVTNHATPDQMRGWTPALTQDSSVPMPQAGLAGELKQIVDLYEQGALTDAEFAEAKARLLAS